jgi:hypothetical protein
VTRTSEASEPVPFPIGERGPVRGRTLTGGEIDLLAWLTYETPLPVPPETILGAERAPRLESGLILSITLCLGAGSPLYATLEAQGLTVSAALSHSVTVHAQAATGDTLLVTSEIVAARRSRGHASRFVVDIRDECRNQHEELVAVIDRVVLFEQHDAGRPIDEHGVQA